MKRGFLPLALACAVVAFIAAAPASAGVKGADVSGWSKMQSEGYNLQKWDSWTNYDAFGMWKELGGNAVRIRIFYLPYLGPSGLSFNNPWDAAAMVRRAVEENLDVMLCFHYHHTFTDPGKQWRPMWPNRSYWADDRAQVARAVATHTRNSIRTILGDDEAMKNKIKQRIKWVQIGNELGSGMLWPTGGIAGRQKSDDPKFEGFKRIFNAGARASKRLLPNAKIVAHRENGLDLGAMKWFANTINKLGLEYDILGVSVYPNWGQEIDNARTLSKWIGSRPDDTWPNGDKRVNRRGFMVVEYGRPPEANAAATADFNKMKSWNVKDDNFSGFFYWEPFAFGDFKPDNVYRYGKGATYKKYKDWAKTGAPAAQLTAIAGD
ncbi:glycosyl hydrolase 53 family protein [Phycisphaera mikurensis]|uniref:Arabinogalactan endo-beta-1,4-galactanase n=1 Tax=Phycisphaera mikurensis (strain NBRC 102666 / KCTC 22515 / FYK2301M01) TaxID=1142394 RepID=I0IGW6_PHYMF|nr:glycosyl hydrolase 53 family protein [Phycisphaera mikurensis]MBB6440761.1 arabinogalactan endo-1,4-beta-galactosidase [Phycisphaera mikurensis]BAM04504.1 putative glycoside hydrolase [Phycisphaera mikurensis NBRC 102666]